MVPARSIPQPISNQVVDTHANDIRMESAFITPTNLVPLVTSSRNSGEKKKAEKINVIKEYLLHQLDEIGARPSGNGLPWSTLPRILSKHGYKFVNWPKDVPLPIVSENKGIMALKSSQINSLYKAVIHQKENRRPVFRRHRGFRPVPTHDLIDSFIRMAQIPQREMMRPLVV
ncbi:hypothetical protein JAAARDRAFT_638835 [Jaapia argillacea MUCL 33604]|uniref:Uncharacterized protein n=1 Tax=Jaapia argillacea MUCL 33604 TaxID=933084 RepID=A0A067PGJ6_9AGAM|nr:hypothetical protein JAAARDRAFT_638835 [Jaapia argillacea MUCL 33604]